MGELREFLERWAGGPVAGISQYSDGQMSSVFSFDVVGGLRKVAGECGTDANSGQYVVRFSSAENREGLRKDRFIAPRAAAVGVPVPRLVHHGEVKLAVGNLSDEERESDGGIAHLLGYSIVDRAPGEHMGELQDAARRYLIPAAVQMMDMISLIDISDTTGYGWFDGEGNGKYESWVDFIEAHAFPVGGSRFYKPRRSLFDDGFLEVDVFRRLSDRMMDLVSTVPVVERSVAHMDFGYDNTLVVGDVISAVLDWDNSIIGDHLSDGARSDLYDPDLDFKRLFADRYELTGRDVPAFDERWLCCQIHVGLQAMEWYGVANKPDDYEWMKARTLHVMGEDLIVGRHPDS